MSENGFLGQVGLKSHGELDCQIKWRVELCSKKIPLFKHGASKTAELSAYWLCSFQQKTSGVWFHLSIYSTCYTLGLMSGQKTPNQVRASEYFKLSCYICWGFFCFLAGFTLSGIVIVQVSLEKLAGRRYKSYKESSMQSDGRWMYLLSFYLLHLQNSFLIHCIYLMVNI